jgi:hypothetical protein
MCVCYVFHDEVCVCVLSIHADVKTSIALPIRDTKKGGQAMDYYEKQSFRQKATIAGIGAAAGGVAWWIVLASVFGWMSPTTAQQQTSDAVQAKVDQVLAPFCADRFLINKAALAKFVKASDGYDRSEIVQNAISKIGSTDVDYELSKNCAKIVQAQLKKTPRTITQNAVKKS